MPQTDKTLREIELENALFDMVFQFCTNGKGNEFRHTFMSAEENAFNVLGIKYGERVEDAAKRLGIDF